MKDKITYKDAGVDVELADNLISSLSDRIRATFKPNVIGAMGGFASMFRIGVEGMTSPVLVSATDGVGTKLKLAFLTGIHDTVGIDLVAMNVNDIVVTGAKPLFFLDYFACGALDGDIMRSVISGIATGCEIAECSLVGGETAEMPDFYSPGEYDLAGFCVGMVDEPNIVDPTTISPGDVLIGLASSGLHSNGFSLVRKVLFQKAGLTVESKLNDLEKPLGEELLIPTMIYVRPVLDLIDMVKVKGIAHITGGGFPGNISRIVPEGLTARVDTGSWKRRPIFHIIGREAGLDNEEMFRTFNMGVGMVIVVAPDSADRAMETLEKSGSQATIIGEMGLCVRDGEKVAIL